MQILLIHGQGRTPLSMALLGSRLRRRGYAIHYFGYAPWAERFPEITRRLVAAIKAMAFPDRPYAVIGHSLGGILTRACLPELQDHPPARLIMLAPPNQPPLLARRLKERRLYRLLTAECGQRLASPAFYANLPLPDVPTTVIAGTAGPRGRWSPFGESVNDGVVSVEETRLRPGDQPLLVPSIHTFIMNSPQAFRHIDAILKAEV